MGSDLTPRHHGLSQMSCGWAVLPLYTSGGIPMPSNTYEIRLHGGEMAPPAM